jgi:hypothetical protein
MKDKVMKGLTLIKVGVDNGIEGTTLRPVIDLAEGPTIDGAVQNPREVNSK